jgi:O-antigen/teichoic acid export membrane protein
MRSLFPSLVKSASDALELQQVTQHMLRLLVLFFAPLPIILSLLAKPLILLLYGEEFVGAVPVLQVLGWSILLSYLSVALHRVLLAVNLENAALKISIVTMLINVSADVLLIPVLGAQGAAIASLLSLFIALLLTYGQIRWLLVNISPGQVWARPGFSLLLSTAITFLLNSYMSPIPLVFVFLMSYFLLLLIVKALSWNEIEALWASTRVYLMERV